MNSKTMTISFYQLCQCVPLSDALVCEVISYGIVEPLQGNDPASWQFDEHSQLLLQKAARLQQDLDINWQGIALVLDLLDQRDRLLQQNRLLQQRLGRFLEE